VVEIPRHFAASGWVNQTEVESLVGAIAKGEKLAGTRPSVPETNSWRTEIKVSACCAGRTKQATKAGDKVFFAAADILLAESPLVLASSIWLMERLVGSMEPPCNVEQVDFS
jgi:hypothetical protein